MGAALPALLALVFMVVLAVIVRGGPLLSHEGVLSLAHPPLAPGATQPAEPSIAGAPVGGEIKRRVRHAQASLPLSFIQNKGQVDRRVSYYAEGSGHAFYFTPDKAVLALTKGKRGVALELAPLNAGAPRLEATHRAQGKVNYLTGSERHTNLATYRELAYRDLWPGIDLVFRGRGGILKYELHVAPGADPSKIQLAYRGADGLAIGAAGNLLVQTPIGTLRDARPVSYQRVGGRRVGVDSRYALAGGTSYGFALGSTYDSRRPLVIDPGLVYSTHLGGSDYEAGSAIAVDAGGNAYVTGSSSPGFPTTAGAFDTTYNGLGDAFVTKVNAAGSAISYSTYLGGTSSEAAKSIAVDGSGRAYVTGLTCSSDFPTTSGAFQTSSNGCNTFVTKLNATGSDLSYSTYLGTSGQGNGIAVDGNGNAYVTGYSCCDFPTTSGAFATSSNGNIDAFVSKLNSSGSALVFSTFLGGGGDDLGYGIAVDQGGRAYLTGYTGSSDFPTTAGAFDTAFHGASSDAFAAKLNAAGSALSYSAYLGGSSDDQGFDIAVDNGGAAYLTGQTSSSDFPTTAGAFDTAIDGNLDAFVTKINPAGSALAYSTFLGGDSSDYGTAISVEGNGSSYVTGATSGPNYSVDFPTTEGAFDRTFNGGSNFFGGGQDAFVSKFNATGSALAYSTYLGSSGDDRGYGIDIDGGGHAYVTGWVREAEFPNTAGAFDRTYNGGVLDGFVTKLDPGDTTTGRILVLLDAQPDSEQNFDFTTGGGLSPGSFVLDDDADPALSHSESFDNVAPGSYSVSASPAPQGWNLSSATCSDGSPVANIDVGAGETVVCTFEYGRPATGSKIVFSSARDDPRRTKCGLSCNREIYIMDPDGSNQTRLTFDLARDDGPVISPDGSKIAFWSERDGDGEIYTMPIGGGAPTQLTHNDTGDTDVTWSPDGTRIAFRADRDPNTRGAGEIYVMNADGSGQTRLTFRPGVTDESPAWSPDGTRLMFTVDPTGERNARLYTMRPNGSDQKQLRGDSNNNITSAWSPDGSEVAFVRAIERGKWPVYRASVTSRDPMRVGKPTRLVTSRNTAQFNPAWSPDGSKVAYYEYGSRADVWVVTVGKSKEPKRLTSTAGFDGHPHWGQVSAAGTTGSLEVKKKLLPSSDPGLFDLRINGVIERAEATDGSTTGSQTVSTGSYRIDEVSSLASPSTLADYDTAIECKDQNGAGQTTQGTERYATVLPGANVVCTVTNTRKNVTTGALEIRKILSPVDDPGRFDLQLDDTSLTPDAGDGDTTGEQSVSVGMHSVGEIGSENLGTDLDDYTSVIECRDQDGSGQIVAGPSQSSQLHVSVLAGADVVCTATNTRKPGAGELEVTKSILPAGDPGRFDLEIDDATKKNDAGDGDTTGAVTVSAGPHTVRELSGIATELSDYTSATSCRDDETGAVIASGSDVTGLTVNDKQNVTCTITNTREQTPQPSTGNLYDVEGGIDCSGDDGRSSRPLRGTVTATPSGNTLTIQVDYQGGDPDTTFSIELFEAGSACSPDNNGNTGVTLTSDSSGGGTATFSIPYPFLTYTGDSLGDGSGSDAFVLVLDNTLSVGAGDRASTREIPIGNTGTLEVKKELSPATDPGRFDLTIDGLTQRANATDGDSTGKKTVSVGTHIVGEVGSLATATDLSKYATTIECADRDGDGETVASLTGAGPLYVPVAAGTDVVCTITNSRHVELDPITTDFNGPVSIDYHEPSNDVAVSVNYPSGEPHNFELIDSDGSHQQLSTVHGFDDEVKVATVRSSSCQGGFTPGEVFSGTGAPGVVARISPDGSTVENPWVTLPGETGLVRGSLFQDRYCAFGGDLIVVTTSGGVWRVTASGVATEVAQLGTHLEGLTTVPDDVAYGPWAGTMLIGAESQNRIYSVAPDGTTVPYELGIPPEDIDIVPPEENFFGVSFAESKIVGAPATQFEDKVGDIVIAQESPGILWDVQWQSDPQEFSTTPIAQVPQWEHVTFAPAGICEIPPTNSGTPIACDGKATTDEDVPVGITLVASDREQGPLTYSIVDPPAHGSLGPITGNTVTYTPAHDYAGPDSFMFKANDGSSDSNVAQVSIAVNPIDDGTIVVEKAATPDDPQDFSFTTAGLTPASFELDDDGDTGNALSNRRTFADVPAGVGYSVAESIPSGWDQTGATCDNGSSPDNIDLSADETVTCTFENRKRGRIVVVEDSQPDDGQAFSFNAGGGLVPASFQLDDDGDDGNGLSNTQTFDDLMPQSGYSIAEAAVPSGWDLASATCSDGNPVTNINLAAGETVTCTFVNKKRGTVIIKKDAYPNETTDFSFTTTGGLSPSSFQLDDDGGQDATLSDTRTFTNVIAKSGYTVTEAPNIDFAVGVACDDGASASPSAGNIPNRGATINLDPGETVTCTFANTGVYPRPAGGATVVVPLVPSFRQCTAPNSNHVAPLNRPSCTAPQLESGSLTTSAVGRGSGLVRLDVLAGNPATPANEANVKISVDLSDVLRRSDGGDYTGKVILVTTLRVSDRSNLPVNEGSATVLDTAFSAPVDCAATPETNIGGKCSLATTANALSPGFVREQHRSIWAIRDLAIKDAGPDGSVIPPTGSCPYMCGSGDESVFAVPGVLTP